PINQSTIASVPILTSSTATSGWLSLSAVPGVEYSLSSTGTWQSSLRAEWRSGQPKLERLWVRYTPQAIGQNFPLVRYVANDSCDFRNQGLLRLEALVTQPVPYAYTITSVRDAKALEPVLEAVYPNPTSSDVTFALSLSKASRVKLTVCTTLGNILHTVSDAPFPAGRHSMTWQSAGLPSGVYGYRLEVDGASVQSGFVSVVR
ncbi:MAG: T9SS type A sorting domain-containing protein, partial [Candidatus Kapabacteria bacterium]|nr:T9SS type A sorting domain-containing protein [Candidatus Kapabacteria bacterium]